MANKKRTGREAAHIEFGKDWEALVKAYKELPSEAQDYADPLVEVALKGGPFDQGLRWPFHVEGDVDKWPVGDTVREYAREGMKRTGKVSVCLIGIRPKGSTKEIIPWDPKSFKNAYEKVSDVLSKAAADPCADVLDLAETLEDSNREYVRMSSMTEIATRMTGYLENASKRDLRETLSRLWTYASVDGEGLEPPYRVYDADGNGDGLMRAFMGKDYGKLPEGFPRQVMCLLEDALHDFDHRDLSYIAVDGDGVPSLWWPDEVAVLAFLEAFDKVTEKQ